MILGKGFKVLHVHAVVLLVCLLSLFALKILFVFCLDFVSQSKIFKTCLIVKCVVYFDF